MSIPHTYGGCPLDSFLSRSYKCFVNIRSFILVILSGMEGWKISGMEKLKTKLKDTWRPYHLAQNL